MRLALALILIAPWLQGATYYLSPNGTDSGAGTTTNAPWRTLAYAVQGRGSYLQPGDTVILRGGLYSGNANAIDLGDTKNCSGSNGAPITIKAYPNESPVITGTTTPYYAVMLYNKGFWTFDGLTWSNCLSACYSKYLTNCIWTNCAMGWIPGGAIATNHEPAAGWGNVVVFGDSYSNKWLNCLFTDWGMIHTNEASANQYHIFGSHLVLGDETADHQTWFNLIEGCTFTRGGHDLTETVTGYNVYRNNLFHNEPFIPTNDFCHQHYNWLDPRTEENTYGMWSARITKPGDAGTYQIDMRNVWESNRFYYTGPPADSGGAFGIELGTRQSIYRFNVITYSLAAGIFLNTSGTTSRSTSNCIYGNVIYGNGLSTQYGGSVMQDFSYGLSMSTFEGRRTNNYILNNIIWRNLPGNVDPNILTYQEFRGNFTNDAINPIFTSTNGWGYTYNATNLPDFRLQSGSPCIDAGTWLTYCPADGSGTTLVLTNSLYFSDGNRVVPGDTIQLQGQTSTATVISNDFARNTLYLSGSLTWTAGQGVSLAYNGAAPDQGAFEYSDAPAPTYGPSTVGGINAGSIIRTP